METDIFDTALGSWADEMDSQPLPAASSNAYSMRDRGDGERRGFEQPSWGSARTGGAGTGGGASSGMGGGDSFGAYLATTEVERYVDPCARHINTLQVHDTTARKFHSPPSPHTLLILEISTTMSLLSMWRSF